MEFVNIEVDETEDEISLSTHLRSCSLTLSLVATSDPENAVNGSYKKLHYSVFRKCSELWICSGRPKTSETIQNILHCQLRSPCATRWNSLHDSVLRLVKHLNKLNFLTASLGLRYFNESELEFIDYVLVLLPIASVLDRWQTDKTVFMDVSYQHFWQWEKAETIGVNHFKLLPVICGCYYVRISKTFL